MLMDKLHELQSCNSSYIWCNSLQFNCNFVKTTHFQLLCNSIITTPMIHVDVINCYPSIKNLTRDTMNIFGHNNNFFSKYLFPLSIMIINDGSRL